MTPAFDSVADFIAMGGYAFYVWLSVCVTLVALMGLILHTALQRRFLLRDIRQRQAREHRRQPQRIQPETPHE
ncbi:heme exporter protein CcmD [Enterobacterales bacterium CwR94]|nr:heme exporter protein CcmD [Enterobacterales bacterium CwR94]